MVRGGPAGDLSPLKHLPQAICASLDVKRLYFRFRCDRPRHGDDISLLKGDNWSPVAVKMGSSMSMELDLSVEPKVQGGPPPPPSGNTTSSASVGSHGTDLVGSAFGHCSLRV